jgi:hypothetical protein
MAKLQVSIDSVSDGFMPSASYGSPGQYSVAVGIDPDMPLTDATSDMKAAGAIRPVAYSAFSGSEVTSHPISILTTPKNTNTYTVLGNGRMISYDSAFANATLVATSLSGKAGGAFYYNNYIYITGTGAGSDDVGRYGPLDGSPSYTDSVWKAATLGSQTALVNTTYPTSILSTLYPNHWGTTHVDGSAYFLDYKDGVGMVHKISTKKVTSEGDTNSTITPSAYNILDLPYNYLPISICSYGNNMVVSATHSTSGSIKQGKAALFFFNPADTTPSFYNITNLPDTICSALWYENGEIYGTSGDIGGGYRLFHYLGGASIETLAYIEEGNPPLQGAVSSMSNRLVWAADISIPMTSSGLYGYGSKSGLFPMGLHNIASSPLT